MDDASAAADQADPGAAPGEAAKGEAAPGRPAVPSPPRAASGTYRLLGRHPRWQAAVLAVAAAALAAATGLLAVAVQDSSGAARQQAAVLAAARQEAVNLTTLDRQSGSRDFDAVLAGAGGSLRQQLSQGRGAFLRTLSSAGVSSAGLVLDAGVVTMTHRTATVLLNVRATVRTRRTYAPETRLYHWRAGLVLSGGRWLVTSLEFV